MAKYLSNFEIVGSDALRKKLSEAVELVEKLQAIVSEINELELEICLKGADN